MTEARIERVYEDRVTAREFLSQAERFLKDADVAGLSAEARTILLHNATICACDAILQASGHRVTRGDGAHALRLERAIDEAGGSDDLLERLDASRWRRNEASYASGFVAQASVDEAREATAEVVDLARGFVPP